MINFITNKKNRLQRNNSFGNSLLNQNLNSLLGKILHLKMYFYNVMEHNFRIRNKHWHVN